MLNSAFSNQMNAQNAQALQPVTTSPVDSSIGSLHSEIDRVANQVELLSKRLVSVRVDNIPPAGTGNGEKPQSMPTRSGVETAIDHATQKITGLSYQLESIISTLRI